MTSDRITKIILTAFIFACAVWLGTNRQFYREALASAFFAIALGSVIIIHLRVSPSWRDASCILVGTILLGAVDFRVLHYRPAILAWLSFAGLTSLLVFGLRTIWATQDKRKLLLLGFIPALVFVTSEYFADNLLHWSAANHPKVLDLYLFSFDSSLRVQLSFVMGRAFVLWPSLRVAGLLFYIGLPIPIALIYAGQLLRVREKAVPAMVALLITGPVGIIFYNLFPALGPIHLFLRDFPWHALTTEQASRLQVEALAIDGPPNAIPSLHMAWVLLVWWYSRNLSWWERTIAMLFLSFTVMATLGTGEHYFIDLVVAFPFALMIEAMCAFSLKMTDRFRGMAFCFGLAGTLGWFALLRHSLHFFWISPVLPWSFCIVTIVAASLLESRLHHLQDLPASKATASSPALSSLA